MTLKEAWELLGRPILIDEFGLVFNDTTDTHYRCALYATEWAGEYDS